MQHEIMVRSLISILRVKARQLFRSSKACIKSLKMGTVCFFRLPSFFACLLFPCSHSFSALVRRFESGCSKREYAEKSTARELAKSALCNFCILHDTWYLRARELKPTSYGAFLFSSSSSAYSLILSLFLVCRHFVVRVSEVCSGFVRHASVEQFHQFVARDLLACLMGRIS